MKKIIIFSLILIIVSTIPSSLAWDGLMAMDADKRNVDPGTIITYQGYLYGDNLIDDELVSITVSEQETGKVILTINTLPNSSSVEYFENTAWPFTFQVGTSYQYFTDDLTYVVEAKYNDKSTKLDFFIQPDQKLDEKASDASEAIIDAGTETGELVVEAGKVVVEAGKEAGEAVVDAGKEAGEAVVEAGSDVVEKGVIVGEIVVEKTTETGQVIVEKSSEGVEEIQEKGGGCLIATAAYGTELSPQVQFLREIRDTTVMSTGSGATFMTGFNQLYYSFSPTIADLERKNPLFQEAVRIFITPMVSSLSILTFAEAGNEGQVLSLGISILALNLGMYIVAPTALGLMIHRKVNSKNSF